MPITFEPFLKTAFKKELPNFFQNLALMVKSGLPLNEALKVLETQSRRRALKRFLANVSEQVESGSSLSKALVPYRDKIGELSLNIIKAGEINGTLEENLQYLADILTRRNELKQKIKATLLYPEIVLTLAFVLGGGISIYLFPRLIPLFTSLDVELPLVTRILLRISLFLRDYGWQTFVGIFVLFLVLTILQKISVIRLFFHSMYLRLPFFGRMTKSYQLALFNQIFGALFSSGLTIKESLMATADAMTNLRYQKTLQQSTARLTAGIPLAKILSKHPKFFPQNVVAIISVGEKSGKLEESFGYLAKYYENDVDVQTKRLPTVIEPILLIFLGLVVAFLAIAVISPIYELTSSLSR